MKDQVIIVGAGLAGSEAAWQIACRGIRVKLYEMRPVKNTPAHHTDKFGELVCSNSLRSNQLENAVGLLKEEMRRLGSLIMECADNKALPAGGALAVDREGFSQEITDKITNHPNIEIIREEVMEIPQDDYVIVATGPLTSEKLSESIGQLIDSDYLYFYDAAAPIITYESINQEKVFKASRYDKGDSDYINCPMTEEEYLKFYNELVNAEVAPIKSFERQVVFEGCMPVETMAKRGSKTLLFGPLKPVGLSNPRTEKQPYGVVQLRQDNIEGTLYNIVGFQTHLKWSEQKRVF
ncbi:MAG: methylenetetrahydrofolate--tRNA-(uracil(54)-C(5))-methyltransferase (FADH(2)-oxidizing) TrmFO, partial [Methanosarcina sp.]|nr:methylenetetrahydrofolate--tRNA-(uracil(54)-C(5))-methyltransferase (FADH(2)-oxidizing) TrmFO [Methanosarcina sp.]